MDKIELLAPAGSMANLKAAVSKGADAVYLGMQRFSARQFATNFNDRFLTDAIKICKSNNVKAYLAMNTLVKNNEIKDFFQQLSFAYSKGIDAVIIQEISFLDLIKENYPDLRIHISTQAGVMNSASAEILQKADRITLARELRKEEIQRIRGNFKKEIEMFCHGALCASVSGQCLFSSFIGGRSGNRGRCGQPCRKLYNKCYFLSTKELCLIRQIPEIVKIGVDAIKIEGRMRAPRYVAAVTSAYRKAIDSLYNGRFSVSEKMINDLERAFSRDFTEGWFSSSKNIFNRKKSAGESSSVKKEFYSVKFRDIKTARKNLEAKLPFIEEKESKTKRLLVRVYSPEDAVAACANGADIVYFDVFDKRFNEIKIKCKLFGAVPRIMLDSDIRLLQEMLNNRKCDGLLAGNLGVLDLKVRAPIHADYNLNCFNDVDIKYFSTLGAMPIISPELSLREMKEIKNKNIIAMVHGKIRLMTLRHELPECMLEDDKGWRFFVNKIRNGSEITNEKEFGLLAKASGLVKAGINNFFIDMSEIAKRRKLCTSVQSEPAISEHAQEHAPPFRAAVLDTDKNVGEIVRFYRKVLDGEMVDDFKLKKDYVLGWSYRGVD